MAAAWLGPLLTGGVSLATDYIGGEMNYRRNKNLAKYAYNKDLEMWNRQNEYNLPVNQMERLDEAGLNPNLMYGTGSGANVAKEMPRYNAPTANFDFNPLNIAGMLSQFQDIKVKQAQADNIKAQTETRRLENSLRQGTLQDAIDKVRYETQSADVKRLLDNLSLIVETEYQTQEPGELTSGAQKKLGELGITQQAARRTKAEADVKEVEAGIYEWIKKSMGNNEDAAALTKLIQLIMMKL